MRRRRELYIVDGYNVIHAWPELASIASCELAAARDRLIETMMEYGAFEQYEIIVVFDALFTTDEAHEERVSPYVEVVYTAAGETADSRIERLSYDAVRRNREVHVVTSDGAEQTVILGAGAYRLPSRELRRRVKRFRERMEREYLAPTHRASYSRIAVSDRIDGEIAAKLDAMRKRKQ